VDLVGPSSPRVVAEGADRLDQLRRGEKGERRDEGEPSDGRERRQLRLPAPADRSRERAGERGPQRVLARMPDRVPVGPDAGEREHDEGAERDQRGKRGQGPHAGDVRRPL
jgi:hypothetical protein